jgi:parallel beta-helix repeat protein
MGYKHNLYVEDSSNVVVGPNALDRNPRYDYGTSKETANSLVFRNCADCTLTGLHVNGVYKADAGVTLENCRRFNVTNCTILDCANVGLLLKDVTDSRVSDCLIRNDKSDVGKVLSLKVVGGRGNLFADNLLGNPADGLPK